MKTLLTALMAMLALQLAAQSLPPIKMPDAKGFSAVMPLLSSVPQTAKEYTQVEPSLLATIQWLADTPPHEKTKKREEQFRYLLGWAAGSPTVNIELYPYVNDMAEKNPEALIYYFAGWIQYAVTNNYSTDKIALHQAGIQYVLDLYDKDYMVKNKKLDKLAKKVRKGKLEAWLQDKIEKQEAENSKN